MSTTSHSSSPARALARVREWWDTSTFVGDVALLFFGVTVVNSVMMVTGLDDPKTGTFAYVHLLGRLGIITGLVALFYLDDLTELGRRWWGRARHRDRVRGPHRELRAVVEDVLTSLLRSGVEGSARVFTAVVTVTCFLTLVFAEVRPPVGGRGLYRNLVVFAVILVPILFVASRAWKRRTSARTTTPD